MRVIFKCDGLVLCTISQADIVPRTLDRVSFIADGDSQTVYRVTKVHWIFGGAFGIEVDVTVDKLK